MQIISVTSEALQAAIRRLLPSQAGFSEDLEAVNTIQPIIDLTPTAEGSTIPIELQQALDYTTSVDQATNATVNLTSTAGFYRCVGTITGTGATGAFAGFRIDDGISVRNVFFDSGTTLEATTTNYNLIFYVRPGDTLQIHSNATTYGIVCSYRQIADAQGNLIDPQGYTSQ